jgi:protein-disulfide isomerase
MGHSLGNESAPVVVSVWGDYQCPYCRQFALGPERQLRESFVKDGQVRYVWNDFPFLGPESYWAAEAADAAGQQDRFWQYHDKLYQEQGSENSGAFSAENLLRFAQQLGLDLNQFASDLQSGAPAREVAEDKQRGDEIGVNSTPTVYVNDQKLPGVPTWDDLAQVIQSLNARAA